MSAGKRPALPFILSANALLDGSVVYWSAEGWSPRLADAIAADDERGAERLVEKQVAAVRSGEVIGPELVAIAFDPEKLIVPGHYRERIRALGPTVRADLGPQASGEHLHVSL